MSSAVAIAPWWRWSAGAGYKHSYVCLAVKVTFNMEVYGGLTLWPIGFPFFSPGGWLLVMHIRHPLSHLTTLHLTFYKDDTYVVNVLEGI